MKEEVYYKDGKDFDILVTMKEFEIPPFDKKEKKLTNEELDAILLRLMDDNEAMVESIEKITNVLCSLASKMVKMEEVLKDIVEQHEPKKK